jgi:DNA (cytosine-5)-methyltransferase 1
MSKLRVLDLFSGVGGFSLGLERTGGFETVAFCEIEPYPRAVLKKHWPEVPCYEDVRTLTADVLAGDRIAVDVIVGGFPCQDISLAGKGAGLAGERSGLWREYARLIGELRPRVVVVENVAALLGRGLGTVLGDLAAFGYDAEWHCIPASAVGAPHRRDRLWVVAYPGGEQYEGYSVAIRRALAAQLLASDTDSEPIRQQQISELGRSREAVFGDDSQVPNANGESQHAGAVNAEMARASEPLANAGKTRLPNDQRRRASTKGNGNRAVDGGCWTNGANYDWSVEPDVGRVAHGVPSRVDRLSALGNAVVPQIPELIGRAILQAEGRVAA